MSATKIRSPEATKRRHAWWWFFVLLALGALLGTAFALFMFMPLAMATDGCYERMIDGVCGLSANGQLVLILIPWMSVIVGIITAFLGAVVATRFRRTPLFGIAAGVLGYLAMVVVGTVIAYQM
ncbi:hypothetical protein [Dietzia timorensis]|uniref:Uncharacterized protein n=1 Tax=Dietzia timorensis TaxID=499555 RepID=A0A173LQG5_9ACTN|nr:hypothetical protein [Dietzia timorensis]ANI93998.1 Hypothetical protein BJL86_3239 [Dietzia timorensis]